MKCYFFFLLFFLYVHAFSQEAPKDTCRVSLPNAHSVNAQTAIEGINIISNCPVSGVSVKIFNRWGASVHEELVENGASLLKWDPSELATGTYFYILKCNQLSGSAWLERNITGHITLLTNKK